MKAGLPGWRRALIARFSKMLVHGRSSRCGTYEGHTERWGRLGVGVSGMARELQPPDLVAVHLVGPVGKPQGSRVRVHLQEREILAEAGAAVGLDRPVDHL